MSGLLRKNKGFLLVGAYMGVLVLVILGVALFSRTIHEHKFATITMDELSARYSAERGIEYAIAELKLNSNFKTHQATGSAGNYTLTPISPPTPQLANVTINGEGCYASQFPTGDAQFTTKIYSDPYLSGEAVVLSKGLSNDQTVLLVTKYVPSSLYRFFIFTPGDFWPDGNYNANGGSIHANGLVYLTGGNTYSNINEFSTAKYFKYYIENFIPPQGDATTAAGTTIPNPINPGYNYTWNDIFYDYRYPFHTSFNITGDSTLQYKNNIDGYARGAYVGLLWQHPIDSVVRLLGSSYSTDLPPGTIPENYILEPTDFLNLGRYACNNYASSCANNQLMYNHTIVNNIRIPNYFSTGYEYNKYWHLAASSPTDSPWCRFGYCWAHDPETMTQYSVNSQYQYSDWDNFLRTQQDFDEGHTLENILKDANTGGKHIQPLSIQGAFYAEKATAGGIHITNSMAGSLWVKIKNYNNDQYISIDSLGGRLVINKFIVFEKKNFVDQNSAETKDVVTLDIGNLKQALGNNAGLDQNIIYSNYPIVLTNAGDILDNGLTTVCENNIYLHGNYNDKPTTGGETFKPSAAISGRKVYTLSGTWDYPQTLQYTFHNPDSPNKWDFYCPAGSSKCIDQLISSGRPAIETTHPSHPEGYNWYALNRNQMTRAVPPDSDPSEPGDNPYVYNVAIVGQSAHPQVLERWWDYTNPGNNSNPPTGSAAGIRRIYGSQIWLEYADFPGSGSWSSYNRRCCGAPMPGGGTFSAPCADCAAYIDSRPSPVYSAGTNYNYNAQFADGDVPPGDLLGYSGTIFLELEDNTTNWTKHCDKISMR